MMIFNPDLILYKIDSWPHGIMIFVMTLLGMAAFTNLTQGFCITRNKWYEAPFFLIATLVLFYPGMVTEIFNIELVNRYYFYIAGIIIYSTVILIQKFRLKT